MENKTENTVNSELQEKYNEAYAILLANLKKLIKELPLCSFLQRTGNDVISISVKNCLVVNQITKIEKDPETGEDMSEPTIYYSGAFTPKGETLAISLFTKDAEELWNLIKEKEKSYSKEQVIEEQNQMVISLINKANKDFSNNEYFKN